jgi:hypothetical protein
MSESPTPTTTESPSPTASESPSPTTSKSPSLTPTISESPTQSPEPKSLSSGAIAGIVIGGVALAAVVLVAVVWFVKCRSKRHLQSVGGPSALLSEAAVYSYS